MYNCTPICLYIIDEPRTLMRSLSQCARRIPLRQQDDGERSLFFHLLPECDLQSQRQFVPCIEQTFQDRSVYCNGYVPRQLKEGGQVKL